MYHLTAYVYPLCAPRLWSFRLCRINLSPWIAMHLLTTIHPTGLTTRHTPQVSNLRSCTSCSSQTLSSVSSLSFPILCTCLCDYTQGCHRHTHTIMCCPQSTGSSSISFFNRDRPRWCRPRRGCLSHILSKDFLVIGLQATHSLGSELFSRQCNTLLFNTSLLSVFLSCALPQSVRGSLALP